MGFSMVEVAISVCLLGLALIGLASSIIESTKLREVSVQEFEANQEMLGILDRLGAMTPTEVRELCGTEGFLAGTTDGPFGEDVDLAILCQATKAYGSGSPAESPGDGQTFRLSSDTEPQTLQGTEGESTSIQSSGDDDDDESSQATPPQGEPTEDASAIGLPSDSDLVVVQVTLRWRDGQGAEQRLVVESLITH